jgi:hypothetical protein
MDPPSKPAGRARRVMCMIRQKSDLTMRAWLTRQGFHHVSTVAGMMPDEELMVYVLGRN